MDSRQRLSEEFAILQQYRGTDCFMRFEKVLKALEDAYKDDLATVSLDGLRYKQGALAQARVLREQLIEPREGDVPKV